MNTMDQQRDRLLKALKATYDNRQEVSLGIDWQKKVMAAVRQESMPIPPEDAWMPLENLVWRLAPVLCVLIALMVAVLAGLDFNPQYGVAEAFMDDSLEILMAQAMGGY